MADLRLACDLPHQLLLSSCRLCTKIKKVSHRRVSCSFLLSLVASHLELFCCWAFGKSLLSQSHWAVGVSVPALPFLHDPRDMSSPGELPCVVTILRHLFNMYYGGPLCPRHSARGWGAIVSNGDYVLVGRNRY